MKVAEINSFVSKGNRGKPQDKMTGNPMIGNPAGVVLVDKFPQDEVMQKVAKEMALSETAFFVPLMEVSIIGSAILT